MPNTTAANLKEKIYDEYASGLDSWEDDETELDIADYDEDQDDDFVGDNPELMARINAMIAESQAELE